VQNFGNSLTEGYISRAEGRLRHRGASRVCQPVPLGGVNMLNVLLGGTGALVNLSAVSLTEECVETRREVSADKKNLAVLSFAPEMYAALLDCES
jgi:hypothetical protein